jgi:hypothetical protein
MAYLELLRTISPGLLIAAGIDLLIVPKWIRIIIAVGLIFLGVTELFPELLSASPPVTKT